VAGVCASRLLRCRDNKQEHQPAAVLFLQAIAWHRYKTAIQNGKALSKRYERSLNHVLVHHRCINLPIRAFKLVKTTYQVGYGWLIVRAREYYKLSMGCSYFKLNQIDSNLFSVMSNGMITNLARPYCA
jgi:hypothetical protein